MKRIIYLVLSLCLVAICIIVPVSASSGTPPYSGLVLNVPVVNHNPDYLVFDDLSGGNSGLYVDFSDADKWSTIYRIGGSDRSYTVSVAYTVFAFDEDFNGLDVTSFYLDYYVSGVYQDRDTISGSVFYVDPYEIGSNGSYHLINLSAGTHTIAYACIVPIPDYYDSNLYSDLYDFYSTSFTNYFTGVTAYQSGFSAGASVDYWDGLRDGESQASASSYQSGYSSGKQDGLAEGRGQGYLEGHTAGVAESQSDLTAYSNAVFDTVSAPFLAISNFLSFNVLGINLAGLFAFIVTALIIAFIIKKLM